MRVSAVNDLVLPKADFRWFKEFSSENLEK
jgi:hypothetical protein